MKNTTPPITQTEAVDMADLKRKSVRGGAVTMVSQAIRIAIQLTSTVVLARLLSPDDYGVMAMVLAVTGFAGLFRDLGLSSAAIQKKDLTSAQQSNLFWLNVAMGATLTALVAAGSPLVAWFYGKPELTAVTLALSASFLIGSLGTQHGARLVREMQFARQAVATISGSIVSLIIAVSLALQGFSYWSLVWGNLGGGLTTTVLLFTLSPFWPSLPAKGTGVRDMLKFGANVTTFDFVNYFSRNLDNILIGRFWGSGPLGFYSRAYSLLMFPINAIRAPINTVAFPSMSKLQSQPNEFRIYYLKISGLLAFLSMPLTAFLFIATSPIIELTLGPKWTNSSQIFAVLALSAFIQPVASLRGTVMLSLRRGGDYLRWGIYNAIAVSIGFACGVSWGAIGVAASYAIVNYLILYPSLLLAFRDSPVKPADFFASVTKPAVSSITAAAIAWALVRGIAHSSHITELIALFGIFSVTYLLTYSLLPNGWRELRVYLALHRFFLKSCLRDQA